MPEIRPTHAMPISPGTGHIAGQKKVESSGPALLGSVEIDKDTFFKNVQAAAGAITKLLTTHNIGKRRLSDTEINYFTALCKAMQTNGFSSNIKKFISPLLKDRFTLVKHHEQLQSLSTLINDLSDLVYEYKQESGLSFATFTRDVEDVYKDLIRDTFWLKEFQVNESEYYALPKEKFSEYFKRQDKQLQARLIFWFTYSRLHWRFTEEDPTIDKAFKNTKGDCTEFSSINAYLLRKCGYSVKAGAVPLKPGNYNKDGFDYHVFVMLDSKEHNLLIDYQKISSYKETVLRKIHLQTHLNFLGHTYQNKIKIVDLNELFLDGAVFITETIPLE